MEAYTSFSEMYDTFMDDIPYEEWCAFIKALLVKYNITAGTLLELGCGTGNMTELLAAGGYNLIALDYSAEMLAEAMDKKLESGSRILYLQQDMREFELNGNVSAVVSVCDAVNYITESAQLEQVFERVYQYLDDGGIFIFDFNTSYKYREILGEQTIAENRDKGSFIWENYYDEAVKINEYELTLFIKEEGEMYRRHREIHYQRAYELEEIIELAESAGLKFVRAYDDYTTAAADEKSERICAVVQKGVQENE